MMGSRGQSSNRGGPRSLTEHYLGRKKSPYRIDDAMKGANPHYSEGEAYQRNCQRCVIAYEMRRRGYNVEAKERGGADDPYPKGKWREVLQNAVAVDIKTNVKKNLLKQMSKWGDGARAIVRVVWKGRKSGHVFIAEQVGGETVFIDPQPGRRINIDFYLGAAIKSMTDITRVDKLEPNLDLLEDCVKKRGR